MEVTHFSAQLAVFLPIIGNAVPNLLEALPVDEMVAAEQEKRIFLFEVLGVVLIAADYAFVVARTEEILFLDGLSVVEVGFVHRLYYS